MLQPAEALTPRNIYQDFPSQPTDAQVQTNLFFFKAGDIWSSGIFLYKILYTTKNLSEIYEEIFFDTKYTPDLSIMLQWMLQPDAALP
jgi:hypothetical protein